MARGEPLLLVLHVLRDLMDSWPGGITLDDLAKDCEVSTRTVRRKLDVIDSAGLAFTKETDDDGQVRYRMDPKVLAAAHVTFEPYEAAALFVAGGMMKALAGLPLAKDAEDALEKVSDAVPLAFRTELRQSLAALHGSLHGTHDYGCFGKRFTDLVDAIGDRKAVEIDYQAAGRDEPRTHRVEPYLVHCHAGSVYLVARIVGRDNLSNFALDRIAEARVQEDETFARSADLDPVAFVDESFAGWHEGDVVEVRVRFEGPAASVVRERVWHPSQHLEELPDGSVELWLETAGPTGVLHWTQSFLPNAHVLEPAWLAERQCETLRAWLRRLDA
jgi:predicted DNA-binding transcriptional regulator YafY